MDQSIQQITLKVCVSGMLIWTYRMFVDAYACIVYISYISKAEREIGLLLGNAQKEASKQGNVDAKDAF